MPPAPSIKTVFRPARLFDTKMRCFTKEPHPTEKCAILSHRWDESEMSYNQLKKRSPSSPISNRKFQKFCQVASKTYGCRYVWMDSACIDRENARELGDSIQSMYWYYRNAEVSIVYLADASDRESFRKSSWFTRGWTLQELLAPTRLAFYYGDWTRVSPCQFDIERIPRGCMESWVVECVSEATGISSALVRQNYPPSPGLKDTILEWAKGRVTSCEEDMAYSLISLLSVYIVPSYGEGLESTLRRLCQACDEGVRVYHGDPKVIHQLRVIKSRRRFPVESAAANRK